MPDQLRHCSQCRRRYRGDATICPVCSRMSRVGGAILDRYLAGGCVEDGAPAGTPVHHVCPGCGEEWTDALPRRRYCSHECASRGEEHRLDRTGQPRRGPSGWKAAIFRR